MPAPHPLLRTLCAAGLLLAVTAAAEPEVQPPAWQTVLGCVVCGSLPDLLAFVEADRRANRGRIDQMLEEGRCEALDAGLPIWITAVEGHGESLVEGDDRYLPVQVIFQGEKYNFGAFSLFGLVERIPPPEQPPPPAPHP